MFTTSLLPPGTRQNWKEFCLATASHLMAMASIPGTRSHQALLSPRQWNHIPQAYPWPPCCWIQRLLNLKPHQLPCEQCLLSWIFPWRLSKFQTLFSLALPTSLFSASRPDSVSLPDLWMLQHSGSVLEFLLLSLFPWGSQSRPTTLNTIYTLTAPGYTSLL